MFGKIYRGLGLLTLYYTVDLDIVIIKLILQQQQ